MNNKLKKYIDYKAMYDIAVMDPYLTSFKKLQEYIGASENTVLMIEEGVEGVSLDAFNYQGRIITYHDPEQIEKVGKRLFTFLSDDSEWTSLMERLKGYENELEPVMNVNTTNALIRKSKDENKYLEIYTKYFNLYLEVITIYLITDGRYHEYSIKELKEHNINDETINQLTLPNKKSSFQIADEELNEIGKLFRANEPWEERFNVFLDKYLWFYLADTHYDFDQIVLDLRNKLKNETVIKNQETKNILEEQDYIGNTDKIVLSRIAELGFQRMELRRYWQWIDYTLHKVLYQYAKENGLPEKTLVFLSDDEVRKVLSKEITSLNVMRELAEARVKVFAALLSEEKLSIYSKQEEIEKIKKLYLFVDDKEIVVKGNVAYKGNEETVTGVARVITWSKDILKELNEILEGEILIVTQTKPDFLPFLSKARAIVADEGGITSHVSIVSRELKIPAIVGTRIATDTIKTGDRVELDLKTGDVKKI